MPIKAAGEIMDEIYRQHAGADFVIKIDCEGAEYEILPALAGKPILAKAKVVMIEWHLHGPGQLIDLLHNNGFTTISFSPLADKAGMIYATK